MSVKHFSNDATFSAGLGRFVNDYRAEVNSFQMKKSFMTKRSTFVRLKLKICVVHSAGIVEFRLH